MLLVVHKPAPQATRLEVERYQQRGDGHAVVVHELRTYCTATVGRSDVDHRHADFDQLLLFEGPGQHHVDFTTFEHPSAVLGLIPMGAIHRFSGAPEAGYAVNIDAGAWPASANIARARGLALTRGPLGRVPSRWEDHVGPLFEQLAIESADPNPTVLGALLTTILGLTIEALSGGHDTVPNLALRYLDLVDASFRDPRPVSHYARMLGASSRKLHAATTTSLGSSPSRLLQERRLLEAKRLLAHTELGVAEIAEAIGFVDAGYFSRFFRKLTGTSPLRFRTSRTTTP